MKQIKTHKVLYRAAGWIEIFVSVVVLLALIVFSLGLLQEFQTVVTEGGAPSQLSEFLGSAFQIVIGVEFIKMLCKHTPATVVEVLMFAIARQMVVEHSTPLENLICIVGITVLFAIRRFLFTEMDKEDHYQENIIVEEDMYHDIKEPCACIEGEEELDVMDAAAVVDVEEN